MTITYFGSNLPFTASLRWAWELDWEQNEEVIFPFEGSQVGIYVKYAGFYGPEQLDKQRELWSGIE